MYELIDLKTTEQVYVLNTTEAVDEGSEVSYIVL